MSQQTENERIKILRLELKFAQGDFANELGLKQGSYSDIERGRTTISSSVMRVIQQKWNISPNWLILGKGPMYLHDIDSNLVKEDRAPYHTEVTITDPEGNALIPVINIKAAAGLPTNFERPTFYKNLPTISMPMQQYRKGNWALIQASGDSMETTISHGQWMMCQRLYDQLEIKDGNVYVVLLQSGPVVKRVLNRVKQRGTLVLQSDNSSYSMIEVNASEDVLQIWRVEMVWNFDLQNRNIDLMNEVTKIKEEIYLLKKAIKK
jgi:phage repressor protein C with HTH and peptisase S24 domain